MIVNIEKPEIIQIVLNAEKDDELYTQCLWAKINFDLKNWIMSATSDCGDYSYRWCVEGGKRTFLQLMCQIDKQYLLGKISRRTRFDLEETKKCVRGYGELTKEQEEWINEVDVGSGESYYHEICESRLFDDWYDKWELVQYDYPTGAKVFAELFTTVVREKLKEYIGEEGKYEGNECKQCNYCRYYEGVPRVQGHAPCSFWKIGGIMYNDFCSRFEVKEEDV